MAGFGQPRARVPAGLYGEMYHQEFEVLCRYDVYFTRDLFDLDNPLLPSIFVDPEPDGCYHVGVCIDDGLVAAQPDLPDRVVAYFSAHRDRLRLTCEPAIIPGGEARKSDWSAVHDTVWHFGGAACGRQDYGLAIGGGAMLDLVGFALSIIHRGVRLVRVPSTVLAQSDAGVGVRSFVNEAGRKDFASALAPPFAVVNDLSLIRSLNRREWIGGTAEAFKIAVTRDASFFQWLCDHAEAIQGRDVPVMEALIKRAAVGHLERLREEGVSFGGGREQPLDFGHWAGHRIEAQSRFWLAHGQAIAVGMALDSVYARRVGLIDDDELARILRALIDTGLPVYSKHLDARGPSGELKLLPYLRDLRRRLGGRLALTLPDGVGHCIPVREIDVRIVAEAVEFLKSFSDRTPL